MLGVESLRDCTMDQLIRTEDQLPAVLFRRARHVVTEIQRTADCAAALKSEDIVLAGRLMNASHASLRDDYEVSCMELDKVASRAHTIPGVFGCRMTGGGFGGCCVALVEPASVEKTAAILSAFCHEHPGPGSGVFVTAVGSGAFRVEPPVAGRLPHRPVRAQLRHTVPQVRLSLCK